MEKVGLILLFIFLAAMLFSYMVFNNKEPGLQKLGNLTICDKFHDKTVCKAK